MEIKALDAVLPQLDTLIRDMGIQPWITSKIVSDERWDSFVEQLEVFSGDADGHLILDHGKKSPPPLQMQTCILPVNTCNTEQAHPNAAESQYTFSFGCFSEVRHAHYATSTVTLTSSTSSKSITASLFTSILFSLSLCIFRVASTAYRTSASNMGVRTPTPTVEFGP
ncbi:hypothetical protein NM688_g9078 [Phlebia brevispora]|uniref:Uncharacterized protein n=1 Tax=Phlebia brevispora TaxID=194682 RepID=A0ACC1RLL8_9APHY|nr:hypothetical protein NM688_g9078 [Phlebia brevispora]